MTARSLIRERLTCEQANGCRECKCENEQYTNADHIGPRIGVVLREVIQDIDGKDEKDENHRQDDQHNEALDA